MRKKTVKLGLNYILLAMVIITITSFFHEEMAWLFELSSAGETGFTLTGLAIGGLIGGLGVIITAVGFLQTSALERDVYLKPVVIILAAVLLLFMVLSYVHFINPSPPKLRPGEIITI